MGERRSVAPLEAEVLPLILIPKRLPHGLMLRIGAPQMAQQCRMARPHSERGGGGQHKTEPVRGSRRAIGRLTGAPRRACNGALAPRSARQR